MPASWRDWGTPHIGFAASDELLFTAFFVVVLNVFCAFWRNRTEVAALYKLVHPPPPVRIKNVIQVAQMLAGQNGPVGGFVVSIVQIYGIVPHRGCNHSGVWPADVGQPRWRCCEARKASGTLRRFSISSRRLERRLNRGRLMAEWDRIGFSHGEGQV